MTLPTTNPCSMAPNTTLQVFTKAATERLQRDNPAIIGATKVTFQLPAGWTAEKLLAFLSLSTMPCEVENAFIKTGTAS